LEIFENNFARIQSCGDWAERPRHKRLTTIYLEKPESPKKKMLIKHFIRLPMPMDLKFSKLKQASKAVMPELLSLTIN